MVVMPNTIIKAMMEKFIVNKIMHQDIKPIIDYIEKYLRIGYDQELIIKKLVDNNIPLRLAEGMVPFVASLVSAMRYGNEREKIISIGTVDFNDLQLGITDCIFQNLFDKFKEGEPGATLFDFIENKPHRYIDKWLSYLEIYERYFNRFRNKETNILEFGVSHGGSLQMWKYYFGPQARIYGVDINERCLELTEERIVILKGDQGDRESLRAVRDAIPPLDIIIDDGGHTNVHHIFTFEEMFSHLKDGGIYLVEDLQTSYMGRYGGGYRHHESFIEYSKKLIDQLNARFFANMPDNPYARSAFALHYYESVIVIEKRHRTDIFPNSIKRGTVSF
jgi:hypothetical protein